VFPRPTLPSFRASRVAVRCLIVAAAAAWLMAPTAAAAQVAQGWTQFQGGPEHRGAAPDGPSPAFTEAWSFEEPVGGATGAEGLSGIVTADGLVVTVGPEAVIALDPVRGSESWRSARVGGPPVQPAVATSPDGAIVVFPEGYGPNPPSSTSTSSPATTPTASPDAATGTDAATETSAPAVDLVAVTAEDGAEVWRTELPSPSRSGVTATADGDLVLVGGNDGSVTAVEASSGEIRWTQPVGDAIYTAIGVTDVHALVSAAGEDGGAFAVIALDLTDGAEAWRYEPGAAAFFGSPPAIADGTAYIASDDATVRAIDTTSGTERWAARMNDITAATPPIVLDDIVVAVDVGGQVYAFDRATGDRRWDHALNVGRLNVRSAAVAVGTSIVVPTARGELFAVEQTTGDLVFRTDVADGVLRSLAVADGLLIGVRGGRSPGLVALEHDPSGTLVRIASPTTFDAGAFATAFALAAVPLVAMSIGAGRLLARRLGPTTLGRPTPRDPIEDAIDREPST
jgi:outer membrane protein assembly factor BamB